jgi:hypothetical protein
MTSDAEFRDGMTAETGTVKNDLAKKFDVLKQVQKDGRQSIGFSAVKSNGDSPLVKKSMTMLKFENVIHKKFLSSV